MCGQNDDPTQYDPSYRQTGYWAYLPSVEDTIYKEGESRIYPPVARTEEELEERLQFDDVVENALWDMTQKGLIE